MKEDNKWVQLLVEGAGAVAAVVLVGLLSVYLTTFALVLYPVGVVVYGIKNGLNPAAVVITIASLIIGFGTGDLINGIILLVLFGPLSIALVYGMKKRKKPLQVLVTGALVYFTSALVVFYIADTITGLSIIKQLENTFKETLFIQLEMMDGMGLSNYEIDSARRMLEDAYKYIILILPSLLMFMAVLISYINYILTVWLLRKLGIGIIQMPWLHRFTVPNNFGIGVLVMFLGVLIGRSLDGTYYDTIFLNLLVIVGMVFILQGLAVMNYFMIKWKMNAFIRGVVIFMAIAVSPVLTAISLIGGVDFVIDFRKLRRKPR
ncbi:MAG: YybS family protein [Bacillota bacterium]